MATLFDLAKRMKKITANLKSEVSRLTREVADAVITDLAYKTPVDTSNALSNWQLSLNKPIDNEIEPYLTGFKGSTKMQSAKMTRQEALLKLKTRKFGETIFIVNNAPYIRDLNNGTSKQEPAGFVRRAVLVGKKRIKFFKFRLD